MDNKVTLLTAPIEELIETGPDWDRAADFLELAAFFSHDGTVVSSALAGATSINAEDYDYSDDAIESTKHQIATGAALEIEARKQVLGTSYPFEVELNGNRIRFSFTKDSLGQVAYVLCLILSDIASSSPIVAPELLPDDENKRKLRQYFQFFATAALASEIRGRAWSFGFPRIDHSGFIDKLEEIWGVINDGKIEPQEGAPTHPKDDGIDVFAARVHGDRLPGFLFAAAQVTTGREISGKSLKGRLEAFRSRWFCSQPVTEMIPYMIVPFVFPRNKFVGHVREVGNLLHRLRIPTRVSEAEDLVQGGVQIEGYSSLQSVSQWLSDYRSTSLQS